MRVIAVVAGLVSVLLVVVLLVAVAPAPGTVERLSASETVEGIDVPTIGSVGDFPDPEHRHVVNVTQDARIVMDGKAYTLDGLQSALTERARRSTRVFEGAQVPASLEHVVLRLDGSLPWGAACRIAQDVCGEARLWKVWYVVRHEDDGHEGAIGLPDSDRGESDGPVNGSGSLWMPEFEEVLGCRGVRAECRLDGDGSPRSLVADSRMRPPPEGGRFTVFLNFDPRLPTRAALELIDASIRAGAVKIEPFALWSPRTACWEDEVKALCPPVPRYVLRVATGKSAKWAGGEFPASSRTSRTTRIHGPIAKLRPQANSRGPDEIYDPFDSVAAPK